MRRRLSAGLLLAALTGFHGAEAQTGADENVTERQVKAAYLSKFGSYVQWPAGAFQGQDEPLSIGVVGADMLADDLAQIVSGQTVNGRRVAVHKLRQSDSVAGVHVLFIGGADGKRLASMLAETRGKPMLTVTEADDALALGSTINFVVVNGKVRFEVATRAADLGRLNISARLLAVAYKVVAGVS